MRVMNSKSFYESFQENLKKEDALLESANQKPKRKLKENIEELQPKYAGRNSFYGKAFVETDGNKKTLTSYKTKIMSIENGEITMLCDEDALTQTTLRHIREFLQQNGIKPLTRKELVDKINGGKNLEESNPAFKDKYKVTINGEEIKPGYKIKDFRGDEHVFLGVTNPGTPFGGMNGKIRVASGDGEMEYYPSVFNAKLEKISDNLEEAFDLDTALADVTEWAESIYKGSEINSDTIKSLLNSKEELKDKYTDNQKAKIVKWFEDEEKKYMPMQEQDQTVRVVTANNDREYTIVDITELNTVSDGDVQAPIDITGLLEKVNERLEESVGDDWGVINYQSTRFNKETNNSNALFELCTGGKTYLMSMLLEENGSLLKVNNTKGQTIFKRKTNGDMVSIVESYIKQFLPKNDEPEVIKRINKDLHDRYDFIKLQIDLSKEVPKEEKDAFTLYLQNQMYSFVAEVSDEIKPNEPTEDDKLELPSFDKMVEDIFGKQWVKEQPKENKLELDGVEQLKESMYFDDLVKDSYNHYTSEIGKVPTTSDIVDDIINNYTQDYIKDDTPDSSLNASGKVEEVLKKLGLTYTNDDEPRKGIYKESYCIVSYYEGFDKAGDKIINGRTPKEVENKVRRFAEKDGIEIESITQASADVADSEYLNSLGKGVRRKDTWNSTFEESDNNQLYVYSNAQSYDKSDADSYADMYSREAPKLKFKVRKDGEMYFVDFIGKKEDIVEYLNKLKWYDIKEIEDLIKPYSSLNEADELQDEKPKNGLGTGYASFARKAANLTEVEDKSKSFTNGDASYLICKQIKLSKDEFDDLQENLLRDNDYCKEFQPLDTDNYSYNVIKFTCPDYDYSLLVDPAGYNYCRYVAKVNRGE